MAEEHKDKTVFSSVLEECTPSQINPFASSISIRPVKLRLLRFSSPPLAVRGLSLSAEGSDPVSDIVLHTFP